jgi:thiamine monophosphate kinase
VHPAALTVARAAGSSGLAYALDGGEDFELLVAVGARAFTHLASHFARHFGKPLIAFGRLEAELGLRLLATGAEAPRELVPAGFDHLARDSEPPQGLSLLKPRNNSAE